MNNFNNQNDENNESVRQTLMRVAGKYGWFDHPVTMNVDGNDVTYYVDPDSPFAKPKQTPTPWNNNYQQQNFGATNQVQYTNSSIVQPSSLEQNNNAYNRVFNSTNNIWQNIKDGAILSKK